MKASGFKVKNRGDDEEERKAIPHGRCKSSPGGGLETEECLWRTLIAHGDAGAELDTLTTINTRGETTKHEETGAKEVVEGEIT